MNHEKVKNFIFQQKITQKTWGVDMKKVRIGYLGVGPRAQGLMECYSFHEQVQFVAFADIAAGRAESVATEYNKKHGASVKAYTSYEAMMKEAKMDALLIAMDPDVQVDYAVDAMDKGIHVMTDVPAAFTIDQCYKLVSAVRKNGVKYQLGEQNRYCNFFKQWRKMAENDEFGKIYYVEGEYTHYMPVWDLLRDKKTNYVVYPKSKEDLDDHRYIKSWRYRTFLEPIYYLPHELSPLLSITGGRISKVSCIGTKRGSYTETSYDACDLQSAVMYNTNDTIFALRAGFASPTGDRRDTGSHWYQIKGTKACAETARSTLDTMKLYRADTGWEMADWGTVDYSEPEYIRNSSHGGTDYYPIMYFIDAILNDKQPPMDVYKAVETAAPAILAAQSARQGGVLLDVPDFRI